MNKLFKNLWEKAQCQKNGICSLNPVLNALDAVILNEIRQIAFYIVRLKELNFTNDGIMQEAMTALCVNISDTSYKAETLLSFFKNLKNIKEKVRDFYIKKSTEMKISYEFITPVFSEDSDIMNITTLIKSGENIVRLFYNNLKEEKSRLINLIIMACKMSALNLSKLAGYKEIDQTYNFEILRLLALTNYIGTREVKFIRRIKEFSAIAYEIQKELNSAYEKAYGKRESGFLDTSIYEGKSILISGGDLDELYNLLQAAPDINVYLAPSMVLAASYPAFREFPNFRGIYGTGDAEFDFSNFKGAIYLTKNSSIALDMALRGKIFATKLIPSDRAVKISPHNLSPLIEAAMETEGFNRAAAGERIHFEYCPKSIEKSIEENRGKKILISIGGENKFKDYTVVKLNFPLETQALYYALDICEKENTAVFFSDCIPNTVYTIITILNKNLHKIYLKECQTPSVNPHITDSLRKDFKVETV